LTATNLIGTVPAFDVYPGYTSSDSGAIALACAALPTDVAGVNKITLTSPNCAALTGKTFIVTP